LLMKEKKNVPAVGSSPVFTYRKKEKKRHPYAVEKRHGIRKCSRRSSRRQGRGGEKKRGKKKKRSQAGTGGEGKKRGVLAIIKIFTRCLPSSSSEKRRRGKNGLCRRKKKNMN